MVHPSNVFDRYASPSKDFRIIDEERLLLLKNKLKDFCKAISIDGNFKNLHQLTLILNIFSLTPDKFFNVYTTVYKHQN